MAAASNRYSTVAIVLHWTIALLILGQIAGGLYVDDLPRETDAQKRQVFELLQLHKSFGVTILLLSLARLGWRLTHRAPPLPAEMAGWERFAARATHSGFYVLMIGVPLLGWAMVSASPLQVPTMLFGQVPWPHLPGFEGIEDRRAVSGALHELHEYGAFTILGLFALHVAAALKHHFINRDDVLARMLPLVRQRRSA